LRATVVILCNLFYGQLVPALPSQRVLNLVHPVDEYAGEVEAGVTHAHPPDGVAGRSSSGLKNN
jgi:hypothetical protein